MRVGAWALAASLLLPLSGNGADVPATLAGARKQVESADYRLSGHLVRVDANGTRTSSGVNIKARWFPGILRVLVEVTSPAQAREHVLLEMRPGGKSTIEIAHPGDKAATVVPFEKWNEGPLGEGFSYEDFIDSSYFWAGQTSLGVVKYGARNCELIRSTPEGADRTQYSAIKSWLDQSSDFPVYVEKTEKGSGEVKAFTYFGLRHTEGVWSATQVEAKIRGKAGSTLLIIDHGSANAHLVLKDFSSTQLTEF
jgi:Outer membrane lipoprotein-sorting protein